MTSDAGQQKNLISQIPK
jgi:outer membrane phospholipase A